MYNEDSLAAEVRPSNVGRQGAKTLGNVAKDISPIFAHLERQNEGLNNLHDLIARLWSKLTPVLAQNPNKEGAKEGANPEPITISQILDRHNSSIQNVNNQLIDILDRLEV